MGQVISLPQCGLTYPNEWFPTPMPQQDSEGPVVEALAAAGRPTHHMREPPVTVASAPAADSATSPGIVWFSSFSELGVGGV